MAADPPFNPLAEPLRKEDHPKPDERHEQKKGFERECAVARNRAHELGEHADDEQINSCDHNCDRVLDDALRGIDIDFEQTGACHRQANKPAGQQHGDAFNRANSGRTRGIQERLAAGVNLHAK